MSKKNYKKQVAEIMRRLYEQGLTTCSGGNVSLRAENGNVFITPSQIDKGNISEDQIAEMSPEGEVIGSDLKPSMETGMHLEIYKSRKDVNAIVHAHPSKATAWACSDNNLENNLCGEARYFLGDIAKAPYSLMGTKNLANIVSESLNDKLAVLLANHGALTVGKNLFQAYDRMEVLENLAELQLLVKQAGNPLYLSEQECKTLDNMRS